MFPTNGRKDLEVKTEVKVCLSFYIFSRIENEEDGRAGVIRSIEHSRRTMK